MIFTAVRHQDALWKLWIACPAVCTHLLRILVELLAHISEVACLSPCSCWADYFYMCGRSPQEFDGTSKQSVFSCTGHVPVIRWPGFHHGHTPCRVYTTALSPEDLHVVQTETLCPEGTLEFLSLNWNPVSSISQSALWLWAPPFLSIQIGLGLQQGCTSELGVCFEFSKTIRKFKPKRYENAQSESSEMRGHFLSFHCLPKAAQWLNIMLWGKTSGSVCYLLDHVNVRDGENYKSSQKSHWGDTRDLLQRPPRRVAKVFVDLGRKATIDTPNSVLRERRALNTHRQNHWRKKLRISYMLYQDTKSIWVAAVF